MIRAALPAVAVAGCGSAPSGPNIVAAGPTSQVVLGDVLEVRVPDHNIDICRDDKGFYAMSANCTHAACLILYQSQADGFLCPCHGSTYDYNGQNQTAPAPMPLQHFKLIIDGGNLYVDTSQPVPATDRTSG
jgi:cytochrome b6-f complex iron-sulfur subunit